MNETKANKKWLDDFTLELRLRNVNGKDTGDAVAHVESYCADSGASPRDAFGDPEEYARNLELKTDEWDAHRMIRTVLPSLTGLVAFFVFLQAIDGVYRSEAFSLNIWQSGFLGLLIAAAIMAMTHLSALVKNKWAMAAFVVVGPMAGVGIALSGTMAAGSPALDLPAAPVTVAAAVVLLGAALWGHFRDRDDDDALVKPTDSTTTSREHHAARAVSLLGNWLLVLAAPVFAVVQYLIVRQ